jgi:hypothetical protein
MIDQLLKPVDDILRPIPDRVMQEVTNNLEFEISGTKACVCEKRSGLCLCSTIKFFIENR